MKNKILFAIIFLAIAVHLHAQEYKPTWESLDTRPVPQWFKDAKMV